ncbi:hypothetical protein C0991_009845 [Blastosporella zonata]|nr:hypothetical protein C0991_009845 [Blastosporella zonata]
MARRPKKYFCDCAPKCKRLKEVSKTTYYAHRKYRSNTTRAKIRLEHPLATTQQEFDETEGEEDAHIAGNDIYHQEDTQTCLALLLALELVISLLDMISSKVKPHNHGRPLQILGVWQLAALSIILNKKKMGRPPKSIRPR